jgi:hypothetical protein
MYSLLKNWWFTYETNSGWGRKPDSNGDDDHDQLCINDYAVDGGSVRSSLKAMTFGNVRLYIVKPRFLILG